MSLDPGLTIAAIVVLLVLSAFLGRHARRTRRSLAHRLGELQKRGIAGRGARAGAARADEDRTIGALHLGKLLAVDRCGVGLAALPAVHPAFRRLAGAVSRRWR